MAPRPRARRSAPRTRCCSSTASARPRPSRCRGTTSGALTRPIRTTRSAGPGRSTRRSSGPSRSRRTSAARSRAWRSPGREDQGQGRHPLAVPPCHRHRADAARGHRHSRAGQVDGVAQKPIEGVSLAYTFDAAAAARRPVAPPHAVLRDAGRAGPVQRRLDAERDAAAVRRGNCRRGHRRSGHAPTSSSCTSWRTTGRSTPTSPRRTREKVQEMRDLMFGEFAKYQVLPLDASVATRLVAPRPSLAAGRTVFTYSGRAVTDIPDGNAEPAEHAPTRSRPTSRCRGRRRRGHDRDRGRALRRLRAVPAEGQAGVHLELARPQADELGGAALPPGKHTIEFDFKYDGLGLATLAYNNVSGIGRGGTGTLQGGRQGRGHRRSWSTPLPLTMPLDTFNIGSAPARRWTTRTTRSRSRSPARSTSSRLRSTRRS